MPESLKSISHFDGSCEAGSLKRNILEWRWKYQNVYLVSSRPRTTRFPFNSKMICKFHFYPRAFSQTDAPCAHLFNFFLELLPRNSSSQIVKFFLPSIYAQEFISHMDSAKVNTKKNPINCFDGGRKVAGGCDAGERANRWIMCL